MNHPIAQFVALTCHANALLQGRFTTSFWPGNSTCIFCDAVRFVHVSKTPFGKMREEGVAETPDAWFGYLQAAQVSAIRLSSTPQKRPKIADRMSAGMIGGGRTWTMEARGRDGKRAVWLSRWEVWDQNAPERRIWRVTYYGARVKPSGSPPATDLEAVAGRLRSALEDVHGFSQRHRCGGFTDSFAQAIDALESRGAKRHGYHRDLAPDGVLPAIAASLLDACQPAWVFGGMGSWNDLAFQGEDQTEYERTSARLFAAVTEAIQAGANASGPVPGG